MPRNRKTKPKARNRKNAAGSRKRSGRGGEVAGIIGLGLAIFVASAVRSLTLGDGKLMCPL
jgi:predicted lipid-binding transport protein (Tim44 family)